MPRRPHTNQPHTVSFRLTEAEWQLLEARAALAKSPSVHGVAKSLVVEALLRHDPVSAGTSAVQPPVRPSGPPPLTPQDLKDLRRSLRQSFTTLLMNLRPDVPAEDCRKTFQAFFPEAATT